MTERNLFDVMEQMGLSREEATQLMLKSLVDSLTTKEQKSEKKKIERKRMTNIERFWIAFYNVTVEEDWAKVRPGTNTIWHALKREYSGTSNDILMEKYEKFARMFVAVLRDADNGEDLAIYLSTALEEWL